MAWTPVLRWVISRAFGPVASVENGRQLEAGAAGEALQWARALSLSARIGARQGSALLEREVGAARASAFLGDRMQVLAREMTFDLALAAFDRVASSLALSYVPLKGAAFRRLGISPAGGRPAADLDLLVPAGTAEILRRELLATEFRDSGGPAYEHQLSAVVHAAGGAIEIHRTIPGVRIEGRRSAVFEDLEAASLLEPEPEGPTRALSQFALFPKRELLVAHALVHTLAQHPFAEGHSGLLMIGDLIDLGAAGGIVDEIPSRITRWIEREVPREEVGASLELVRHLAGPAGDEVEALPSEARTLLEHLLAIRTDSAYAESLKLRSFELPISDLPRPLARLRLAWRTLVPARRGPAERREPWAAYLSRVGRRPGELFRKWRSARSASIRRS